MKNNKINTYVEELSGIIMHDIEKNLLNKSIRSNIDKDIGERVVIYIEDNFPQYRIDISDISGLNRKVKLTGYRVLD